MSGPKNKQVWLNLSNFIADKTQDCIEFEIDNNEKIKEERFETSKPLQGSVKIFKSKHELVAHFKIKTEVVLSCDRCLKKIQKRINLDFSRSIKEKIESSEDIKISAINQIEILEPIKQEIILNIPIKVLCQKDCQGIKLK